MATSSLIPAFIKRADKKLLLNNPRQWSTRLYLLGWFFLLFGAFCLIITFITLRDPRTSDSAGVWTGVFSLMSFIGLVVWLIYLLRFNVFKRFGIEGKGAGIKNYVSFLSGAFLLLLPALIPWVVNKMHAQARFSTAEMISDVQEIDSLAAIEYFNAIDKGWKFDTLVRTTDSIKAGHIIYPPESAAEAAAAAAVVEEIETPRPQTTTLVKATTYYLAKEFNARVTSMDSIKWINDSTVVKYHPPSLTVFNGRYGGYYNDYDDDEWRSMKLYRAASHYQGDRSAVSGRIRSLVDKYKNPVNDYDYPGYTSDDPNSYYNKVRFKYNYTVSEDGYRNVSRKHEYLGGYSSEVWQRYLFYVSVFIASMIWIFRHSTVRAFFLAILTAVVLFIFTIILTFGLDLFEGGPFGIMILYFIIAVVLSLGIFSATKRSLVQGIALNLMTFFLPLMPMIIYATIGIAFNSGDRYYDKEDNNGWPWNWEDYIPFFEVGGFVLFLLLMQPLIKKLYRKWYSLPEN